MAWPCREEIYPGPRMAEARAAHVEVARVIAAFEPVTMVADPERSRRASRPGEGQRVPQE